MESEWPLLSLREAGIELLDCEHRTPPPAEKGFPYIAIPQIKQGRLDLTDVRYISHDHFIEWIKKTCPKPWDVILSRRCNPGETAFVPPNFKCALGQNLVILRSNGTRVIPEFLRWLVRGPYWNEQVQTYLNVGAVFDSLKCQDVPNFRLPIPPLPEQRAIAHILGTLDDKIELNRQMNETLEAMARAIFKSWFVDFDPVRAKAEGRDTGLPEEIAELFPDSFEETELGEVPKGWQVKKIQEVVKCIKGKSYKSEHLQESQTALVTLKSFARGGGYRADGLKAYTGDYKPEQIVQPGELVIACTDVTQAAEVIGRPAIVESSDKFSIMIASLDVLIVRPSVKNITVPFLYCLFKTDRFADHTYAHSTGTTVLHLSKKAVPSYKFACPPEELHKRFASLTIPIFTRIDTIEQESRTLAELRDTLLPKLISGELRIKDAGEIIGNVPVE